MKTLKDMGGRGFILNILPILLIAVSTFRIPDTGGPG